MKFSRFIEVAAFVCAVNFARIMYAPSAWAAASVCLLIVGYGFDDEHATATVRRVLIAPLAARRAARRAALNK